MATIKELIESSPYGTKEKKAMLKAYKENLNKTVNSQWYEKIYDDFQQFVESWVYDFLDDISREEEE